MKMKNLGLLISLTEQYFKMQPGELIDNYLELTELCNFQNKTVFIKRKPLKHFVESRSKELVIHFNSDDKLILNLLISTLEKIEDVFLNYDTTDVGDKGRKIVSKDFSHEGLPNLRIVYEDVQEHIEIVSIHFRKLRK